MPFVTNRTAQAADRAMTPIILATLGFGAWHSLLSARCVKDATVKLVGERAGRGGYRAGFIIQSFATTGALLWFILTRPQRVIYSVPLPFRAVFWLGQAASLGIAFWSIKELNPKRFLGIQGVQDALNDESIIAEPETQTPHFEDATTDHIPERGPYRWSRHPIEWSILAVLWLTPTLKTNWLAFDFAATIYMFLGAWHEERLLENRGGDGFRAYQKRVAFVFGRRKPSP